MFLVMFPGVAKLGNICFGRKICGHPCHFLAESGNIRIRHKKFEEKISDFLSSVSKVPKLLAWYGDVTMLK